MNESTIANLIIEADESTRRIVEAGTPNEHAEVLYALSLYVGGKGRRLSTTRAATLDDAAEIFAAKFVIALGYLV